MSAKPIRMFSILARGEERNGKLIGILLVSVISSVVTIAALVMVVLDQQTTIGKLSAERIMFGFPDDDGIFVSSDTIPETFIIRYAKQFASNLHNYDFRSAKPNMVEARSMMSLAKAEEWTPRFQKAISQAADQKIGENVYFTGDAKIETKSDGYVVSLPARLTKYQGGEVWYDNDVTIAIELRVVEPTKFRKEGLEVIGERVDDEGGTR